MSPEDELMGLVFLGIYLVLAPASSALCAVPLGIIYGVVAGLRSRRNALLLIAVPALLAALLVTFLVCGLPLWSFARQEGLPSNELFPFVVATLVTFIVALLVWSLPIGAAVSIGRVLATRGWKPTIVTLGAALLVAALVAAALSAVFLMPALPRFSEQSALANWILPATIVFGSAFALCCIFFGPIVRFARWTSAKGKEPELPLPLERVADEPTGQMRWTRHQRIAMVVLAAAVVAVFGCLGVYLLIPRPCPPAPTAQMAPELLELRDTVETDEERLMVEFLMNRYDPTLGLLEESPNIGADRFFVHADSYLAGLDTSWYEECYHLEPSPHWRVLRDRVTLPEEEIMWGVQELDLGGGVYSYQPDADVVMPLDLWADRLLLAALSAKFAGNDARQQELVEQAQQMWDGKCLRDEYYRWHERERGYPACETFKTALYYYLTGDEDALAILRKMQETDPVSPNYGGIYNLYDQNSERFPPGEIDANSETTAVVLLSINR